MAFYELVTHGICVGQSVVNVFWYRGDEVITTLEMFYDYSGALAAEFLQEVWESSNPAYIGGYAWQDVQHTTYELDRVNVYGYGADSVLLTSTPYTVAVNQSGLAGSSTNGPDDCVLMKASLKAAFGPGLTLPKKGHLKLSPVVDTVFGNDGRMESVNLQRYTEVGFRMADDLVTSAPIGLFHPIRTRVIRVEGVVTAITYRDVLEFIPRTTKAHVASREVEA